MDLAQLIADAEPAVGLRLEVVAVVEAVLHALSQGRQVAGLLEALDGGLAPHREPQMPRGETGDDDADDTR